MDEGLTPGRRRPDGLPTSWKIALAVMLAVIVVAALPAIGLIRIPGQSGDGIPGPASRGGSESWNEIFSQDFDEPAPLGTFPDRYRATFSAYPYPWTDTSRKRRSNPGYYDASKTLSVQDGYMDIWLHYDAAMNQYLVAAPVPRLPNMVYGRFELRLRSDVIPGYHAAPMLWPVSGNFPDEGEIDMPEGALDGTNFVAYSHYAQPADTSGPIQAIFPTGVNGSDWHTYETRWSPGKVEFFVDGESIGATTRAVPSQPMYWVLQFETQLTRKAPDKSVEGHVKIDWVRAWEWTG